MLVYVIKKRFTTRCSVSSTHTQVHEAASSGRVKSFVFEDGLHLLFVWTIGQQRAADCPPPWWLRCAASGIWGSHSPARCHFGWASRGERKWTSALGLLHFVRWYLVISALHRLQISSCNTELMSTFRMLCFSPHCILPPTVATSR